MADESPVQQHLLMDRTEPIGNSEGPDGRRRFHVKVSNFLTEPIPIEIVPGFEGLLSLLVNANFLKLGNYDHVVPSTVGTFTTLSYYESGSKIAQAVFDFTDITNWDLTLAAYINDDDGSILNDDDGTELNLD